MKVLEVCSLGYGGIQNVVYSICKGKKKQIEYYVLGTDCGDNNIERFEKAGTHVIVLNTNNTKLKYLIGYARTLKVIKPDCVHLHQLYASGFLAFIAKCCHVRKIVIQSHNTKGRGNVSFFKKIYIFFAKKLIQLCGTHFIAVSKDAAEELFSKKILQSDKYKLIRNGVDFDKFDVSKRNNTDFKHDFFRLKKKVIVSVGRLTKQKNFIFLLKIMKQIIRHNNDIRLIIAGDGEDRDLLLQARREYGLDNYVDFIGVTDKISDLMLNSDLFVLPSLWEGFGIVFLEAQACGLRCLSSSILPHEVNMGLIEYMDLEEGEEMWALKCIDMIQSNEKFLINPEIKKLFDEKAIRTQYENIYLE